MTCTARRLSLKLPFPKWMEGTLGKVLYVFGIFSFYVVPTYLFLYFHLALHFIVKLLNSVKILFHIVTPPFPPSWFFRKLIDHLKINSENIKKRKIKNAPTQKSSNTGKLLLKKFLAYLLIMIADNKSKWSEQPPETEKRRIKLASPLIIKIKEGIYLHV